VLTQIQLGARLGRKAPWYLTRLRLASTDTVKKVYALLCATTAKGAALARELDAIWPR
jgi:hypothetical protein